MGLKLIFLLKDSSHRAVRAADNVVQAYDLDMQVPEEPSLLEDDVEGMVLDAPVAFVEENSSSYANYSAKRKRDTDSSNEATGIETPAGSDISIPVIRLVQIRGFVRSEVNDLVNHNEVKPIFVHNQATELGERLTIALMDPTGGTIHKTIEWEVQSSVPTDIMIEEKELSKTFTAIIANALKFTSDGGQVKIDIRLSPKLRYFVFTVRDNGCGIPDSFQPRIFQAFSREDESITRHNEGLGLGLLVAKGNARKIGGDLYLVKSSTTGPDKGSHFELKIPICPFDSYARQETSSSRLGTPDKISTKDLKLILHENIPQLLTPGSPTERFTSTRGRQSFDRELGKKYPHKILVAEDSSLNRRLVVTMLAKMGYDHVLEAFDGKEAVRLMEDNEEIDLILMDLWMPNMDGYEATERIIAMDKKKNRGLLKILAVTADITDAALGRAKEVGMVGYMTKPFKVIELERLIIVHSSEP